MKKHLKYIALSFILLSSPLFFYISYVLYEEIKVRNVVKNIFLEKNYSDISLAVCHEEKCIYDFGEGNEKIKIYTVGRDNIESRVELAREVAKVWPQKNHFCKTFSQNRCQL